MLLTGSNCDLLGTEPISSRGSTVAGTNKSVFLLYPHFIRASYLLSVAVLLSVSVLETPQLVKALLHALLFLTLEFFNFLVEVLTILPFHNE